jgi:hypothetical protein
MLETVTRDIPGDANEAMKMGDDPLPRQFAGDGGQQSFPVGGSHPGAWIPAWAGREDAEAAHIVAAFRDVTEGSRRGLFIQVGVEETDAAISLG